MRDALQLLNMYYGVSVRSFDLTIVNLTTSPGLYEFGLVAAEESVAPASPAEYVKSASDRLARLLSVT